MESFPPEQRKREKIKIFCAKIQDSHQIWEWRNDIITREMSISNDVISWEAHLNWFEKTIRDPNCFLYIGHLSDNQKIGICRFDVNPSRNEVTVSINLSPSFRSMGLSSKFLKRSISLFRIKNKEKLIAIIRKENLKSINCFEKIGFYFHHSDDEFLYYTFL